MTVLAPAGTQVLPLTWCANPDCGGLGACPDLTGVATLLGIIERISSLGHDRDWVAGLLRRELAYRPFIGPDNSRRFLPLATELTIHEAPAGPDRLTTYAALYHGNRWRLLADAPAWSDEGWQERLGAL